MRIMRKLVPAALALALVAGCTTTMVPVGSNRAEVGPVMVDVIVGQRFPSFMRTDPYTPLHITVRNHSDSWIHLRYSYFTLVDPDGRAYVIAPVEEVFDWLRWGRWDPYYGSYYPRPIGDYVFREGRLKPRKEMQAVAFFHQATRFGQGLYTLVVNVPENQRPLEFAFRLE